MAVFTDNLLLRDNQLLVANSTQQNNAVLQPTQDSAAGLLLEGSAGFYELEEGTGYILLEQTSLSPEHTIVSDGFYNSTPGIATAENGNWVLTYRKGTGHVSASTVITRVSSDAGATWGPEVSSFPSGDADPGLFPMVNGDLLLTFAKLRLDGKTGGVFVRITNNGTTLGSPTYFDPSPSGSYGAFPPNAMMVGAGNVQYVVLYEPSSVSGNTVFAWTSSDDGFSWKKGAEVRQVGDASINESSMVQAANNTLFVISRDDANTHTWGHVSHDQGLTWSSQVDYTSQVGVLQDPVLIRVNGSILLFGRDYPASRLVMYISNDNGVTFINKTIINTYSGNTIDGAYCWPMPVDEKTIYLVYYSGTTSSTAILGRYITVN
jgi:hypothetical protein